MHKAAYEKIAGIAKRPHQDTQNYYIVPNEGSILEMHYLIEGSAKTPYTGGIYHGKLIFPQDYPLNRGDMNGIFTTAAGVVALLSAVLFAMRFFFDLVPLPRF